MDKVAGILLQTKRNFYTGRASRLAIGGACGIITPHNWGISGIKPAVDVRKVKELHQTDRSASKITNELGRWIDQLSNKIAR